MLSRYQVGLIRIVRLLALIAGLIFPATLFAQANQLTWPRPERVWGYEDSADTPLMVADQNRTVHAMNSRTSPEGAIGGIDITYRNWVKDKGWSQPVDVIISPKKNIARLRGLMLDPEGYLHVVFYGGDEQDASIYYTYAPALTADDASKWIEPKEIAPWAGPINDGGMTGDGDQKLFVVYTGSGEGMGAYSTYSLDGGINWSDPQAFHLSVPGSWPTRYSLLLDSTGRLHVAWSEGDSSGLGHTLYYARLDVNQSAWTSPVIIDQAIDYEVNTPSMVEYDGQILMVYHNGLPTTHWMRITTDYGNSWSGPQRLFDLVGGNGPLSFVEDSAGILHAFFGNRTSSSTIHGMWHSIYDNGRFSQPSPVIAGPRVVDEDGGNGFDPSYPDAIVVQGNTILLTWRTDPGAGRNGIWYTDTTLDSPELPIKPLSALILPTQATPTPETVTDSALPTPLPEALREPPPPPSSLFDLDNSLTVGLVAAFSLILLVVLLQWRRRML